MKFFSRRVDALIVTLYLVCLLCSNEIIAQDSVNIQGNIFTADSSRPVSSANIIVYQKGDSQTYRAIGFAISDSNGYFLIKAKRITGISLIRAIVRHALFIADTLDITPTNSNQYEFKFYLFTNRETLKEVVVKNDPVVRVKGDTIEYSANAFKRLDTRKIEDLFRNIEGFSISPSGKITYRGKEIKAVLINGENLTKEQYQILTRNLNADIVDRIQVFDNFNENRVIGSVLPSEDAAINLNLKKELEGKASGTIAIGSSLRKRHEFDANLLWLKNKIKAVNIFNYNSISKEGYIESTSNVGAISPNAESFFITNLYKGAGLVFPPSIGTPPVPNTYFDRNGDIIFSPLFHVKINNVFKMVARYTSLYQLRKIADESLTYTIINPQDQWQLLNTRNLKGQVNLNYLSFTIAHDNQKKFAGELNLQAAISKNRNNYLALTNGVFTDTLSEFFLTERNALDIQYKGALKLNIHSVLSLSVLYNRLVEPSIITVLTNRYNKNWQLAEGINLINQYIRFIPTNLMFRSMVLSKKGKAIFNFGIVGYYQSLTNKKNLLTADQDTIFHHSGIVQLRKGSVSVKSSLLQDIKSNLSASVLLDLGVEKLNLPTINSWNTNSTSVWTLLGRLRWRLKAFSSVSMTMSNVKTIPGLQYFVNGYFLQSHGGIYKPAQQLVPIRYSKVELGYNTYNLLASSSFQVSAWGKNSLTDYTFGSTYDTAIIFSYPLAVKNNWEYGITMSGRTYISSIKSSIGIVFYFEKDKGSSVVNDKSVVNKLTNSSYSIQYLTSFKSPFNTEIKYTKSHFLNRQKQNGNSVETKNATYFLTWKSKLQFDEKYYFGTEYNFLKFLDQKDIHLFDIYTTYLFSKRISVDCKVHNIFNVKSFQQVSTMPNVVFYQKTNAIGRYVFFRCTWSF